MELVRGASYRAHPASLLRCEHEEASAMLRRRRYSRILQERTMRGSMSPSSRRGNPGHQYFQLLSQMRQVRLRQLLLSSQMRQVRLRLLLLRRRSRSWPTSLRRLPNTWRRQR